MTQVTAAGRPAVPAPGRKPRSTTRSTQPRSPPTSAGGRSTGSEAGLPSSGPGLMLVAMVVFIVWPPPASDAPVASGSPLPGQALRGFLNLDLVYMGSWLVLIPVVIALYPRSAVR